MVATAEMMKSVNHRAITRAKLVANPKYHS